MPDEFLLPCECGKSLKITKTQAGQDLTCDCGLALVAPSLRGFGQLVPAAPNFDNKKAKGNWTASHGFVAGLGALVLCVSVVFAIYFGYQNSNIDTSYTTDDAISTSAAMIETASPGQLWAISTRIELEGLGERTMPDFYRSIRASEILSDRIRACLIAAACSALVIGATVLASRLGKR